MRSGSARTPDLCWGTVETGVDRIHAVDIAGKGRSPTLNRGGARP